MIHRGYALLKMVERRVPQVITYSDSKYELGSVKPKDNENERFVIVPAELNYWLPEE